MVIFAAMRRSITQENLRAITDPYGPEVTAARWRGTRRRMLRVLFYALLLFGGLQMCSLSRKWTAAPGGPPRAIRSPN